MDKPIIIIPTNSKYIDVVENFLQMLKKNWPDCPYDTVVSVTGKKTSLKDTKSIYCGEKATLIDCIVKAIGKRKNCICILGDMFMNKRIDNEKLQSIINTLIENKIQYCSLSFVKNYKKEKLFNEDLRLINNLDRYSHNFAAFFASDRFVKDELSKFKTDLDFEKGFLYQKEDFYYTDRLAVRKNYLNIVAGITKGEWDRINYRKLKKDNPEIVFADRPVQSRKNSIICHVRGGVVHYLPSPIRVFLKKCTEKICRIDFGVED